MRVNHEWNESEEETKHSHIERKFCCFCNWDCYFNHSYDFDSRHSNCIWSIPNCPIVFYLLTINDNSLLYSFTWITKVLLQQDHFQIKHKFRVVNKVLTRISHVSIFWVLMKFMKWETFLKIWIWFTFLFCVSFRFKEWLLSLFDIHSSYSMF